jgi:phosphoribosylanthranilate isomerase
MFGQEQELFIKICGITNRDDALMASSAGANAIGFHFNRLSERYVSPERAGEIAEALPEHVSKVGVFVGAPVSYMHRVMKLVPLSAVQLLGNEGPDDLVDFESSVIKVFQIGRSFDVEVLRNYLVDAFLLDCRERDPSTSSLSSFHWDIAARAKEFGRIILSGGLSAQNVEDAVRFVRPYGVDVCSGVESKPGKKDPVKLKEFVARARNASLVDEGEEPEE